MSDELYEGTARPLEDYTKWRQICPCGIPTPHAHPVPTTVPIDWPDRFRAAAEEADRLGDGRLGLALRALADDLADRDRLSPHDAQLIGRSLLEQRDAEQPTKEQP